MYANTFTQLSASPLRSVPLAFDSISLELCLALIQVQPRPKFRDKLIMHMCIQCSNREHLSNSIRWNAHIFSSVPSELESFRAGWLNYNVLRNLGNSTVIVARAHHSVRHLHLIRIMLQHVSTRRIAYSVSPDLFFNHMYSGARSAARLRTVFSRNLLT